jgi:hypothetical protein
MIRKLSSGKYRLYSHETSPVTGRLRAVGNFRTRAAAERRQRELLSRAGKALPMLASPY